MTASGMNKSLNLYGVDTGSHPGRSGSRSRVDTGMSLGAGAYNSIQKSRANNEFAANSPTQAGDLVKALGTIHHAYSGKGGPAPRIGNGSPGPVEAGYRQAENQGRAAGTDIPYGFKSSPFLK